MIKAMVTVTSRVEPIAPIRVVGQEISVDIKPEDPTPEPDVDTG